MKTFASLKVGAKFYQPASVFQLTLVKVSHSSYKAFKSDRVYSLPMSASNAHVKEITL